MKKSQCNASRKRRQGKSHRRRKKAARSAGSLSSFQSVLRSEILGHIRQAVAGTAEQLVRDELTSMVGDPWSRKPHSLRRNGAVETTIVLDGEPHSFERPRVRDRSENKEVCLQTVAALQSRDALDDDVYQLMARGVSTRRYEGALTTLSEGLGLKKSAVSRAFQRASQGDLDQLNGRSLSEWVFAVVFVDGVHFKETTCVVALGITTDGQKVILGVREGASENATLVKDLFDNLKERGLTTCEAPLFVLDGAKALKRAVRDHYGKRCFIQRCHEHKKKNVLSYLPQEWQAETRRKLNAAWGMTDEDDSRHALNNLVRWLRQHNESAAASLEEGLEETLTVHRLGLTGDLRRILKTTNIIESALSGVRDFARRVKRWRDSAMVMRWVASGSLHAEQGFRRVKGYRDIPEMIRTMSELTLTSQNVAA